MFRAPVVVTPPAEPLVSLAAMKTYGRIDGDHEDDLIEGFIASATEMLEVFTGRAFIYRTLRQVLDSVVSHRSEEWWDGTRQGAIGELTGLPTLIGLPSPPLASITGIELTSDAGIVSTLAPNAYTIDGNGFRVSGIGALPAYRASGGVAVTYVAGYGPTAASVPAPLKTACMVQVQAMYEMRDCGELCMSAQSLAQPYRVLRGV